MKKKCFLVVGGLMMVFIFFSGCVCIIKSGKLYGMVYDYLVKLM